MNTQDLIVQAGFVVCLEGEAEVVAGGAPLTMTPGVLCFCSPVVTFSVVCEKAGCRLLHLALPLGSIFPILQQVIHIVARLRIDTRPYLVLDAECLATFVARSADIEERRQRLAAAPDEARRVLEQMTLVLIEQQTVLEFLSLYCSEHSGDLAPEPTLQQSIVFGFFLSLWMNFKRSRTVDFYASEANVSVSYFSRIIKQRTGRSPMQIIHTITCTAACNMLRRSSLSIKEIAQELGFPEQFTFRKYFKTHVGVSPSEYREHAPR